MAYVSVSAAKNNIAALAKAPEPTVLTQHGEPVAMLLPIREYRAMQALLRLAVHPERIAHVMSAHQRVQRGELDGFVDIEP